MSILITGYSGFTGRYIIQTAHKIGVKIQCLSADGTEHSDSIDLLDYCSVKEKIRELNPSSVIHLAAVSHVQHVPACDFYNINVGGTRNILQALKDLDKGLINCVFASSANVYGNSKKTVIDEKTPLNPTSDYGVSKKFMEELLNLWKPKIPITITRPFNYTGIGQGEEFLIPKIVKAFKTKQHKIELGNLDISRDFSDVRFIAKAYLTLALQKTTFRVLNLCSGESISLKEIIEICSKITNHQLEVKSNPLFMRRDEILTLRGNSNKMVDELGYCSPFCIKDTLTWMLQN